MRFYLRVTGMVLGLLVAVPLHFSTRWFLGRTFWPRRLLGWVGRCAGLRVRVEGTPLPRHVLFVSNHVSWLDILALAGATGTAFVAKGEMKGWPLIGWLCTLNDTIFVDRAQKRTVHDQADALRTQLAGGRAVTLFPEGTTGNGREVLPFRPSLLASVFPPLEQLAVQPVAIDYGAAVDDVAWVGEEPAGTNAKRVVSRRGVIPVRLRFADPIDPHQAGDRKTLAALAQAQVAERLGAQAPSGATALPV